MTSQTPSGHAGSRPRKRILFVAEAATLAHVARPYALAESLDPSEWEVVFASSATYRKLFPHWPWQDESIESISPQEFMRRLAQGARLYSLSELQRYVRQDLELLNRVRPDVVVGDFRLSLSVSARVSGVPYIALSNAYWSPYVCERTVPVPCIPLTGILGVRLAGALFNAARPVAFAWHAAPLERLRRAYGLPPLGHDLRRVYTDADVTLYADVPELVPTRDLPPNHGYIGPVEWAPRLPMPELPPDAGNHPLIYVTLGSSGAGRLLPTLVEALAGLDCHVALATAGAPTGPLPSNITAADYLPGDQMCELADLVICNGGSPTCHQALARGKPVLGIPFNLDQHLNMGYLAAYGAGLLVRPERLEPADVRTAVQQILSLKDYRTQAQAIRDTFERYRKERKFERALAAITRQ